MKIDVRLSVVTPVRAKKWHWDSLLMVLHQSIPTDNQIRYLLYRFHLLKNEIDCLVTMTAWLKDVCDQGIFLCTFFFATLRNALIFNMDAYNYFEIA